MTFFRIVDWNHEAVLQMGFLCFTCAYIWGITDVGFRGWTDIWLHPFERIGNCRSWPGSDWAHSVISIFRSVTDLSRKGILGKLRWVDERGRGGQCGRKKNISSVMSDRKKGYLTVTIQFLCIFIVVWFHAFVKLCSPTKQDVNRTPVIRVCIKMDTYIYN